MKKQFLLIALAMFAGITVYGQIHVSDPRPVSLTDDAGHPIAGKPYTYAASGTPAGGAFLFWATKDANFISTNGAGVTSNNSATMLTTPALITTSANYGVAGPTADVSITWSDATLNGTVPGTTPTFVAAHYSNAAAGGVDNFNAWEIQPIKAFIVDVKNIDDATKAIKVYDAAEDQNADIVRSATYAGGTVNYDFGTNTMYFEVVAANFTVSWTPTLAVIGLDGVESADIMWTAADPSTWTGATVWNAASTPVVPDVSVTDLSLGVSIYVRVIVTHHEYEGLADRAITLQVDGENIVGDWDVVNNLADGSAPGAVTFPIAADQMDIAIQTIKARPALTIGVSVPVTPAFLPTNKKN
jgi:hypothetical protein